MLRYRNQLRCRIQTIDRGEREKREREKIRVTNECIEKERIEELSFFSLVKGEYDASMHQCIDDDDLAVRYPNRFALPTGPELDASRSWSPPGVVVCKRLTTTAAGASKPRPRSRSRSRLRGATAVTGRLVR